MSKSGKKTGPKTPEGRKRALANLRPPFAPGEVANPHGRKSAGATVREWFNVLVEQGTLEDELRRLARDKRTPPAKRMAAERILKAMETGDLADFEPWLRGDVTLDDLRKAGTNTELLKKARIGAKGEREIELHDRGLSELDSLMKHTEPSPADVEKNRRLDEGKPTENVGGIVMRIVGPRRAKE